MPMSTRNTISDSIMDLLSTFIISNMMEIYATLNFRNFSLYIKYPRCTDKVLQLYKKKKMATQQNLQYSPIRVYSEINLSRAYSQVSVDCGLSHFTSNIPSTKMQYTF